MLVHSVFSWEYQKSHYWKESILGNNSLTEGKHKVVTLEAHIAENKLSSLQFWDVQSLEHEGLFQANQADFLVKPQVAPWRLLLIGTIYHHTPANSDKCMLFSLFLITTICNEERENRGVGELVSNRMNNLDFFVEFVHAGVRWIEVIASLAKQIAAVNSPIHLTHVSGNQSFFFNNCTYLIWSVWYI